MNKLLISLMIILSSCTVSINHKDLAEIVNVIKDKQCYDDGVIEKCCIEKICCTNDFEKGKYTCKLNKEKKYEKENNS